MEPQFCVLTKTDWIAPHHLILCWAAERKWMRTVSCSCIEMSPLPYCWYRYNGCYLTSHLISKCTLFIKHKPHAPLFWSRYIQNQLNVKQRSFYLSMSPCVYFCVCLPVARRDVTESVFHIQAISGLRSLRPCKQPPASSFFLSLSIPLLFFFFISDKVKSVLISFFS